ncbi:hypothetical protein [Streptomyces cavernae]|uniref:hypothetical protein n=1 Tax=Streptomyces cavernae TaxID=2259034 RepID=UPI000FEBD156|nr:hypothetical protein [Streptomyces cavernae]
MKHSTTHPGTRNRHGHGPARRIGRSLALVLPVVLVLSGTLAVTQVNWSGNSSNSVLTASEVSEDAAGSAASSKTTADSTHRAAPQDVLRDKLLLELHEKDPGAALTQLQQAVNGRPALARHCTAIARELGRAAVRKYGPSRAQSYSRPVCDTAFASGVAAGPS